MAASQPDNIFSQHNGTTAKLWISFALMLMPMANVAEWISDYNLLDCLAMLHIF